MHSTSLAMSTGSPEPITAAARTGPYERLPAGGKRHASTARAACAASSTIGTTTPSAPASSARISSHGSLLDTRTIGLHPAAPAARIIPTSDT